MLSETIQRIVIQSIKTRVADREFVGPGFCPSLGPGPGLTPVPDHCGPRLGSLLADNLIADNLIADNLIAANYMKN